MNLLRCSTLTKYMRVILALGIGFALIYTDYTANLLYGKDNPKAKGELLATYLSIIGGCAVIYGLYLNNKRIKEQTRQNDITLYSNNDKRFGDAIGYLNSENVGIAMGGVHTLFQIAKEDHRYVSIVVNIFCEYITDNPDGTPQHDLKVNNLITKLILDSGYSVFISEALLFHDTTFYKVPTMNEIKNVTFDKCKLLNIDFKQANNLHFKKCKLNKCSYLDCSNLYVYDGEIINVNVINSFVSLKDFSLFPAKINSCSIISQTEITHLNLDCYNIIEPIKIKAPRVQGRISLRNSKQINEEDPSYEVVIETNQNNNLQMIGDNRLVQFMQHNAT